VRNKRRPACLAHLPEILVLVLPLAACGAPTAVALKGEAAATVRRGIASGTGRMDHSRIDRVLKGHARNQGTRFDYAGLRDHPEDLEVYLEEVRKASLASLGRDELLALLINAYNAYTIQSVLETMTPGKPDGVASIRDIPDVFDRRTHRVGGFSLSLNNIEHNLIRPLFKDPRIHFAVNCASIGCPPLPEEAFTGERIEAQLESAARRTLSSPDYVRVEEGHLRVTKLLDWYGPDFVTPGFQGSETTRPRFIRKYASAEVRNWLDTAGPDPPLSFLDYDWSLNRAL